MNKTVLVVTVILLMTVISGQRYELPARLKSRIEKSVQGRELESVPLNATYNSTSYYSYTPSYYYSSSYYSYPSYSAQEWSYYSYYDYTLSSIVYTSYYYYVYYFPVTSWYTSYDATYNSWQSLSYVYYSSYATIPQSYYSSYYYSSPYYYTSYYNYYSSYYDPNYSYYQYQYQYYAYYQPQPQEGRSILGLAIGMPLVAVVSIITTLICVFCCCMKIKVINGDKRLVCRKSTRNCTCCLRRSKKQTSQVVYQMPMGAQGMPQFAFASNNSQMQPQNLAQYPQPQQVIYLPQQQQPQIIYAQQQQQPQMLQAMPIQNYQNLTQQSEI